MSGPDQTANQAPDGAPLSGPNPELHPQDSHSLSPSRARLEAVWDALTDRGAIVRRVELEHLDDRDVDALVAHEARRLRIIAEADAPGPRERWR